MDTRFLKELSKIVSEEIAFIFSVFMYSPYLKR